MFSASADILPRIIWDKTVSWDWSGCFNICTILAVATATVEIHIYFAFYWDILMLREANWSGSWSKRPHSKTATPKTATTLLATKTATTKTATLYWSKRPHREDHYQNGQPAFGQNGHKGRITAKTATLYLVKTATKGGSLPQRPHCIWSKRPHRKDHYQNGRTAFGQNGHK